MEPLSAVCAPILDPSRSRIAGVTVVHHTPALDGLLRTPEHSSSKRSMRAQKPATSCSESFEGFEACACGYFTHRHWHMTRHKKSCAKCSPQSVGRGGCGHSRRGKDAQTQTLGSDAIDASGTCKTCDRREKGRDAYLADIALGAVACPFDDGHSFFSHDAMKRHFIQAHPTFLAFVEELLFPKKDTLAADMGLL